MAINIEAPPDWQIAESVIAGYFPMLSAGIKISGKPYVFRRNNRNNIYVTDWAIFADEKPIAWIDTEHKPRWKPGYAFYPNATVAITGWKYNKGETDRRYISGKVQLYRAHPDHSFWMPIRSDYKRAGIITGRDVIESDVVTRVKARKFVRDFPVYQFPREDLIFCDVFETSIEEFVIDQLEKIGAFNG